MHLFERSEFLIYTWASQYRLPWKKNSLRACLRLNFILVWGHLILDCRWRQTTTEQLNTFEQTTTEQQNTQQTTHSRPHGQKQQHTPLTQPAHSAHAAGSTQTTGPAGDNRGQQRAAMESVCPLGVCPLSVSTDVSW